MRVRIISKEQCPVCQDYLSRLKYCKDFEFEVYDADDPEHQEQLDKWDIIEMPVVQIISDEGELVHQFLPGGISPRSLNHFISKLSTKQC